MTVSHHATVSHTLSANHLGRLGRLAFRAGISRSSIIEHALARLFELFPRDRDLMDHLLQAGATRKRRNGT